MKIQDDRWLTWMPRGVKVADSHAAVDEMYINEVVAKLVDINGRSHQSWDVLQAVVEVCGSRSEDN